MAVVMGWLARSRLRSPPQRESGTLRHPASTLAVGLVCATFFFGIAVVSNTIGKNSTTTIWTTLCFVFFGLMSLPMIADYLFARHQVSDTGIEYGRMFGQRGKLLWSDVHAVKFSDVMKWFVLEQRTGSPVRISAMLMGLPEFAKVLLSHVPPQVIDNRTRALLEETRAGNPPRIWG